MTRFVAPNLADLGDVPQVIPVDFEAIKSGRDDYLVAALAAYGVDYDVAKLDSDPLARAFSIGGGHQEMKLRQRLNEAVRGLSLATAIGGDLDHLGATYAGVSRLVYDNAADDPPVGAVWDAKRGSWVEADGAFRARIALAPEAFSTAGPEGAYLFHALELDGVRDVADAAVYSEEDGAVYTAGLSSDAYTMGLRTGPFAGRTTGAPVLAPETLVVVLPTEAYGPANQALLDRVFAALNAREIRPVGDNLRIEPATVVTYNIDVTLTYAPGADVTTLKAMARDRLTAYADDRRRIALPVQRSVIGGRAAADNRATVTVTQPAADVTPGPKGVGEVGTITVRTVQSPGSWL